MRFHQDVVALKPAAAIIFLGQCDDFALENRMSITDTKSHLAHIARLAKGSGIRLAISSVTPINDKFVKNDGELRRSVHAVRELNHWIEQLCTENGYFHIDAFAPLDDGHGKARTILTDDRCSLNAAGYEALAPSMERALVELNR